MTDLPASATGHTALDVAVEAARVAGRLQLERFAGEKRVFHKGRANVVTDVDTESEQAILALLKREYPGFGLLAEESEEVEGHTGYRWIVDPLDGTRNYASSVPHFCVVVALALEEEVLLGITYDPVRNELFRAEQGKGAFLNDTPIHVSRRERLADSLLGFDMGYVDERGRNALRLVEALWPGMQSIRIMGSAGLGLAYAAAGRLDLYFHHHLSPWDLASGILLVREAGGVVTERQGDPTTLSSDSAIASSATLHAEFMRLTDGMPWREM